MKVIVVANQKGGVGKSTIACNLAVAAANDGKKVMIIDADPQGSSMQFRALRQADNISAVSITQPTIFKDVKNFNDFDLVIVDAGGRDNALLRSSITAAIYGLLLIPVLPSGVDVWATEDTFQILKEARGIGAEISAFAIFNQVKPQATLVKQAKEALTELTADNDVTLLESKIGDREDFKKAFLGGFGVTEYDPKGKAAGEISALYNELNKYLLTN
ncbi:AAA family ATPase [Sporomusa aerivorans]|uniref:nucleotide-binding protein n=1 Tax=Sporomusa aerivorans TaxID=204936 RepID=UPI00352A2D35